MVRTSTWAVAGAVLAALLGTTAPASAATGQGRWMPPSYITTESAVDPRVAINATGEGLATWGQRTPEITQPVGPVSASVRPPGGQFGPPKAITPGAVNFAGMVSNAAGDASVLAWNGNGFSSVFRKGLGDFSAPVDIEAGWGEQAIDQFGNTTIVSVVEDRDDQTGHTVRMRLLATTRTADGVLGPPRPIASAPHIYGVSVGTGNGGEVIVAWRERYPDQSYVTQPFLATAPLGGDFGQPVPLDDRSPDNNGARYGTRIVTNARGDVLVAWGVMTKAQSFVGDHVIHSRLRPAGGEFGEKESVPVDDERGRGLYRWDIALSNLGDAVAAWQTGPIVLYSYKPAGRPWEAARPARGRWPVCCAEDEFEGNTEPTVTFDGKGTATVAYTMTLSRRNANGYYSGVGGRRLMTQRRAAGEKWAPREQVAEFKNMFALDSAADLLGNTVIVWSHEELNSWEPSRTEKGIGSVVFDASVPSVTSFEVDPNVALPEGEVPAFEFKLSEAAAVSVTVERGARKPVRVAKVSFRSKRGSGAKAIDEQLVNKLRAKGSYRATVVARDSQGRRSKPRRVSFRSLKAR